MRGSVRREALPAPPPGRGPHALFRHGRVGPFGLDEVLVVERLGQLEGDPARGCRASARGARGAGGTRGRTARAIFSRKTSRSRVGVARGARQGAAAAAARRARASAPSRASARDLGLLLLAQGGDEVRLEIEQPRHHLRGRELRIGLPRQLRVEAGFERAPRRPAGAARSIAAEVLGQLRLDGAAQQEVAAEAEEDRLRAGRGGLRAATPASMPKRRATKADERPRGLDEQAGSRERVEAGRIGAVGPQPVGQRRRSRGRAPRGRPGRGRPGGCRGGGPGT